METMMRMYVIMLCKCKTVFVWKMLAEIWKFYIYRLWIFNLSTYYELKEDAIAFYKYNTRNVVVLVWILELQAQIYMCTRHVHIVYRRAKHDDDKIRKMTRSPDMFIENVQTVTWHREIKPTIIYIFTFD